MDIIFKRRSVREYTNKEIHDKDLIQIIKAGMNAPSAHNKQPWSFIIIKNKEILNFIAENKKYAHMLKQAQVAIALVGENTTYFWQQDMGAATQNILLAATFLGIGSCWIGIDPNDEQAKLIKEKLEIPENLNLFCLVSLGYPKSETKENDKFNEELIHYNKW